MITKNEIQVGRSDRTHLSISRDKTNPDSTIFVHLISKEDILIATARVYLAEDELRAGTITRYSLLPECSSKPTVAQRIFALLTWERADKVRQQLY